MDATVAEAGRAGAERAAEGAGGEAWRSYAGEPFHPVLIRAVPWVDDRARNARALRYRTSGRIVWDTMHDGYETYLASLMFAAGRSAIHLEDDVILCRDWRPKIETVIAEHPDHLIQFYSDRNADVDVGSRWEPGRTFCMNQCVYIPGRIAGPLYEYSRQWLVRPGAEERDRLAYDTVIGYYLRDAGERYYLHVPSLVQHHTWRSQANVKRTAIRQSRTFRM